MNRLWEFLAFLLMRSKTYTKLTQTWRQSQYCFYRIFVHLQGNELNLFYWGLFVAKHGSFLSKSVESFLGFLSLNRSSGFRQRHCVDHGNKCYGMYLPLMQFSITVTGKPLRYNWAFTREAGQKPSLLRKTQKEEEATKDAKREKRSKEKKTAKAKEAIETRERPRNKSKRKIKRKLENEFLPDEYLPIRE